MIRFIHSSDLHLGKRFGNFSADLPGRLREARHAVIALLARHAREQAATTILLAGDTFDTETPAPDVRRQALAEMGLHAPIRWVILPGNHDSLQAAQLWANLRTEAPENVALALEARPLEFAPDAVLLPAPCTTRRPGRDLTEWMDGAATPDGTARIGLAHGAVLSFSEGEVASDVIAPDRARWAGDRGQALAHPEEAGRPGGASAHETGDEVLRLVRLGHEPAGREIAPGVLGQASTTCRHGSVSSHRAAGGRALRAGLVGLRAAVFVARPVRALARHSGSPIGQIRLNRPISGSAWKQTSLKSEEGQQPPAHRGVVGRSGESRPVHRGPR